MFDGIIDVYDENVLDMKEAWAHGVRAILHEISRGTYKADTKYLKRREAAKAKGFLWIGYHLLSAESVDEQIDFLLGIEDCSDASAGLAIDWESSARGTMKIAQLREMIAKLRERLGFHPMLYGGSRIRETTEIVAGDPLLAKCPLWYARYTNGPLGIPRATWPSYTLWQFDDEHRNYGGPDPSVLPGADWNRFQGSYPDLQSAWPWRSGAE